MIRQDQWSNEADAGLSRAIPDAIIRSIVASEVRAGISTLWLCESEKHKAFCVTRVDQNPLEFVIVAFEGTGMHEFAPAFIEAAKARAIPMRCHTVSEVVARLVRRFGFDGREFVLRRAA